MFQYPLNANTFDQSEIDAVLDVMQSGIMTMHHRCEQFESAFAHYVQAKHAIFVNSGSSANLLAFFALANRALPSLHRHRLNPGAEVIVPATTWSTSIWPIVQAGGIPVLVDSDPDTLQMRVDAVEKAITPRTVAICCVHILGNAAPIDPIMQCAKAHDLWVIEDTCESLGTTHQGKKVGTWGDMGTYSFYFSHHISTIEGGMIVTDDDDLADLLRCLRSHGWARHSTRRAAIENQYPDIDPSFLFINTGFNVRPTEIQAALGLSQLPKINRFNQRRNDIATVWRDTIASGAGETLFTVPKQTPDTQGAWFNFQVICKTPVIRQALKHFLNQNGVETRPVICGNMARQPAMQSVAHRISGTLDGADKIMDCGLCWGLHPAMTEEAVEHIRVLLSSFIAAHTTQNGGILSDCATTEQSTQ